MRDAAQLRLRQVDGGGGIDLWDLTSSRTLPLRTCGVPLTTWTKPVGMAFSSNGAAIAAFFEQDGKGVMYSFATMAAGHPQHTHTYAVRLPYPANVASTFTGKTLEYVSPNEWLMFGRTLIDTETGKVLGGLQIDDVVSLSMDLWAIDEGLTRIEPGLAGV